MDVSTILRPEQLPFVVPDDLELEINELIDALERDDELNLDCYLDEVQSSVSEDKDAWIRHYYVQYGWRNDEND